VFSTAYAGLGSPLGTSSSPCNGYSDLVANNNFLHAVGVTITNICDAQNAIVGSPNSATSLMFQQDYDMSDPELDLDSADAAASVATNTEPVKADSALKQTRNNGSTYASTAFEDAVYYPNRHDDGAFIPMDYRSYAQRGYRFMATSGEEPVHADASLRTSHVDTLSTVNAAGLGANYSGIGNTDALTLPIDYKLKFNNGYALLLNLPFSYIKNKNTTTFDNSSTNSDYYSASLGAGFKIPLSRLLAMKNGWSLMLLSRVGGVTSGNNNDNSSSIIYSGGVLSEYDLRLGGGVLGIKNMLSYYGTASETEVFKSFVFIPPSTITPIYGTQTDHIDSGIFRNGFYYSHYLGPQLFGRKLSGTVFFSDTRFAVSQKYSAIYMDNMQQVGFHFGLAPRQSKTGSFIRRTFDAQNTRIGMTYTTAELPANYTKNIDGFTVNFGFTF
jgi:hypothetical protein